MVPAFPGAEGGGATATGGRGGRIIVVTNTDATGQGSLYAALKETGTRSNWQRFTPNTPDTHPITVNSVNDLDTLILPTVGNSRYINSNGAWVNRIDVARSRQIQDYISSIGTPKTSLSQYCTTGCTNGYPTYYKVNPYTDSDNDGISNVWAAANGINADNPANKIAANGYSNLENFINGEHNLTCPSPECNFTITQ